VWEATQGKNLIPRGQILCSCALCATKGGFILLCTDEFWNLSSFHKVLFVKGYAQIQLIWLWEFGILCSLLLCVMYGGVQQTENTTLPRLLPYFILIS